MLQMKKIWLVMFFLLILQTKVFAEPSLTIMLNGEEIHTDSPPFMENGRIMVPIRVIAESLKGNVTWDSHSNTVLIQRGEIDIKVTIGQGMSYRNKQPIQLDVPAKILKGRTYVPLRFVAESFGEVVNWRNESKTVVMLTQEFIKETTEDLISKIDNAYETGGIIKSTQAFHEKWRDWHKLFDGFSGFTDSGIKYVPYEYWIPKNEPKLFVIRMINRWKLMDDQMYSNLWLEGTTPVQDTIVFIDLSDNTFNIKWIGVLTGYQTNISIPFDNSSFDKKIQEKLPKEYYPNFIRDNGEEKKDFVWGWEKQYGTKPVFNTEFVYFEHSLVTDQIIQKN